jgi:predicted TIM-barrel fold metal-dependent hydrolase/ribosomal protein S18 acetylase RimI-like enzyme
MPTKQLQMIWPERRLDAPPAVRLPKAYRLRPFKHGDEQRYVRLMNEAGFKDWNEGTVAGWEDRALPSGLLVIEHTASRRIVASAMALHRPLAQHPGGGELGWVAGDPRHAGKGIGQAVCAAAVRRLVSAGYERIYLLTDDGRLPAIKVYFNLGFVPFLQSWDMQARWKSVCGKLGVPFEPRRWPRAPRRLFVTRQGDVKAQQTVIPWREPSQQSRDAAIFREELDGFLPRRILDFHVHVMNQGVLPAEKRYDCAGHRIFKYDLEDLDRDLARVFPGRQTYAVCFGFPNEGYDMARNNAYVAARCDRRRFFPFRLFDPSEKDRDGVREEIVRGGFVGLKPYLNYVRKQDPNRVEIREMLPDWIMRVADDLGLIVTLHIPRKERLADPLNQRQIVQLCRRYPRARIVLAHVGRAYYVKNIVGYLDRFRDFPNLWYDLAMLNNWEVLEYLFHTVPPDRILYASDAPIALAPGKSVEINHQYTYVTPVPWPLSISDDHKKLVFTSFLYEELRAIKKATERSGLGRAFVEGLFYGNGMRLLKAVAKSESRNPKSETRPKSE